MPMRREDCLDVSKVQPQALNSGYAPGAVARNLSTESRTGGEHLVMELPAGWSLPRGRNEADIDLYVLEGSLDIGGENWMQGCYGYFPAGMAWGPLQTAGGCRLLLFTSRPLAFEEAGDSLADAHVDRHIGRTNTWHLPWVDPMADIVKRSTWKDPDTGQEARPPGVLTKGLRKDDGTKEVIALTALAPGFVDPGTEHHPHNECLYLIAGDCYIGYTFDHKREDVKEDLILTRDHYIGRPPGVRHGPVCSISGAFWLIYLADYYTGIFGKVDDWEERVNKYFASASFR